MNTTNVARWLNSVFADFDYHGLQLLHQFAADTDGAFLGVLGFFDILAEKGVAFFLIGAILLLIPRTRVTGLTLYAAVSTASIITLTLKPLIQRARPFMHYASKYASEYAAWYRFIGSPADDGFAFPSGHTTVMMAGMTALALSVRGLRRGFRALLFVPVVLTGLYRCVTMAHYPSDIMGGIVAGALGAVIGHTIIKRATPWILASASFLRARVAR